MGKYISYLLSLYNKNTEKRNLLQFKCKRFLKLMTLCKFPIDRRMQGVLGLLRVFEKAAKYRIKRKR